MPADGAKYKIVRQPRYAKERARIDDKKILEEIEAAESAIAASPYEPEPGVSKPERLYEKLGARETTGGTEPLHLMVAVRKLQIRNNGYIVKYTIRESGQLVYMEDLDLPMLYRLPKFQP
jgi:hypothetical protein